MTARENVQVIKTPGARMAEYAKRVRELEALVEVARAVSSSLDLKQVLEVVLEISLKITGAGGAVIHLLDEEWEVLRVACQSGVTLDEKDRAWTMELGEGVSGDTALHKQVTVIDDIWRSSDKILSSDKLRDFVSLLSLPICRQERLIGTLTIFSQRDRQWQLPDQHFWHSLGSQIGLAIFNAKLYERDQVQARTLEHRTRELEQLNDELLESELILHTFFQSKESALVLTNATETIIKVSPLLKEFLDMDPDLLVGKPVPILVDTLLPKIGLEELAIQEVRDALLDASRGGEFDIPYGVGNKFLRLVALPLASEVGRVLGKLFVLRDITDRKEADKKLKETQALLLQSEKLASIGQLAAGVAHELNNPIAYVRSNLGTLREYVGEITGVLQKCQEAMTYREGGERETCCQIIEEAFRLARENDLESLLPDLSRIVEESLEGAERVAKIVQDLKSFSHVDEAQWKYADINQGLESTLNIVWNELKYKATVIKELGDVPEIECYPMQLNQVFMNLLVNAAQAISEKGEIRVRTYAQDQEVVVEISDTGVGIPPEHLSRLFEPFFTTKPVGKGTGLGLSIAYGIVKKHGGLIEVESEPGKGSLFRVKLPMESKYAAAHDSMRG